jgi:hypothetical protein
MTKPSRKIQPKKHLKSVADQVNVLVEQIKTWRDDAYHQRLFESAIFWGEKVLNMTGYSEPMDIYCLAEIYYYTPVCGQNYWVHNVA